LTNAEATPIATTLSKHHPPSLFARPAEQVAPGLIGCLLVRALTYVADAYTQASP